MLERLTADTLARRADDLAALLRAVVDSGSSVGFLAPLDPAAAKAWWLDLVPAVERGDVVLWVAVAGDRVVGTVQLRPSPMPNGTHRAELAKLMVHPDARGAGTGSALLAHAEARAPGLGLRLLVLDTERGSAAEPLYRARGWTEVGAIPDYAADPAGVLRATVYFYKRV